MTRRPVTCALGVVLIVVAPLRAGDFAAAMEDYSQKMVPHHNAPPSPSDDDAPMLTWLALADTDEIAPSDDQADAPDAWMERGTIDGPATGYVHWKERRGPAYPGDFWRSFGRDAKELLPTVWDDTKAAAMNQWVWIGMGAAVASAVAIDAAGWNGCVEEHYDYQGDGNGSQLNTFWDTVGDVGGNPGLHFAVAGAMYFSSLYNEDVRNYEIAKTTINALAINGVVTLALKGIAHSEVPNGGQGGWPSGHTSSTFCLATVMHEAYGPWAGVPLFAFASFVGYERIDARNHDFHDVISGALIGIVIGHAVYQNHEPRIAGFDVIPYMNPENGAVGVALAKQW